MSTPEIVVETLRWLRFAQEDLAGARLAASGSAHVPRHACWFAQQAAEKALKAALIFLQIDFPRTHDLETLRDLLPTGWGITAVQLDVADLADWAVAARYPGRRLEATAVDAVQAVEQARIIVETVRTDLEARGIRPPSLPQIP